MIRALRLAVATVLLCVICGVVFTARPAFADDAYQRADFSTDPLARAAIRETTNQMNSWTERWKDVRKRDGLHKEIDEYKKLLTF